MASTRYKKFKARIKDLKIGMTILAYTEFTEQYRSIENNTCEFIRHNFKGTTVTVTRDDKRLNLPVDELTAGDSLNRIYNFPASLTKITVINLKLIQELQRRGMVGFIVQKKKDAFDKSRKDLKEIIKLVEKSTAKPKKAKKKVKKLTQQEETNQQVNGFVAKVKECIELRDQVSSSVEESMDNARNGKVNIGEIQNFVNTILKNSSTEAMSAIVNLKESEKVYDHCIDVGTIFQTTYEKIIKRRDKPSSFKSTYQMMMAGFLHDFGMSKIPKDILDNTKKFARHSNEMKLLRSHPLFGAVLLSDLDMPACAINMAHYHHIKLDTTMLTSYPENVDWKEVVFETRLLSIIDIYQALTGRRKYKRSWSAPATMRYLDALSGVEYDLEVWEDFLYTMGIYPLGSLIELTDGSLGFVMNVPSPGKDLERPLVAVTRNADGEDLTHHSLIDLQAEKDIAIERDVDYPKEYGERALDVFTSIQVS